MINGMIGRKIGMTQVFSDSGIASAVTAIEAGPCMVTQIKDTTKDGYSAVQLGFMTAKRLNAPQKGHLGKLGNFKYLREIRLEDNTPLEVGSTINVSIFKPGDRVDISGLSKGRGFAGAVKRHGFKGGPKTHGQSDRQRAPGSVGSGTTPGHPFKDLRMAGHMGYGRITVKNLVVVKTDVERNLLLVRGAVPGAIHGLLEIKKSKKQKQS